MMFSSNIDQLARGTIVQTTHKTNTHISPNYIPMNFRAHSLVESSHVGRIGQVLLNVRTGLEEEEKYSSSQTSKKFTRKALKVISRN